MANKNKVEATVKGEGNSSVAIGGSVGGESPSDSENEVRVTVDGKNNRVQAIGGDVLRNTLGELEELVLSGVDKKSDREYIAEIIQQLNEQAAKAKEERNEPKIKGLLNNLSTYVGIAGAAVAQAEKIRALYEQVLQLFS